MQKKKQSLTEAVINTLIGFLISLAFTPLIYWFCGIKSNAIQITNATILFTLLSVIRGYIVRRYFNKKHTVAKSCS